MDDPGRLMSVKAEAAALLGKIAGDASDAARIASSSLLRVIYSFVASPDITMEDAEASLSAALTQRGVESFPVSRENSGTLLDTFIGSALVVQTFDTLQLLSPESMIPL